MKSFLFVSRLIEGPVEREGEGHCQPTADIMPLIGPVSLPLECNGH